MFTLLIKHALVADGSGRPEFVGDIAVSGDTIAAVETQINARAHTVIDGQGLVALPGFIDPQNHSDAHGALLEHPSLESLTTQGITTAVVGQCGGSLAPILTLQGLVSLRKWRNQGGTNVDWQKFSEFMQTLGKLPLGCHVGSMVGYGNVRRAVVGDKTGPVNADEQSLINSLLSNSLEEGALGVSVGLAYAHESSITELELYEVAKLVAERSKILSMHLRSEADSVLQSLAEVVDLAEHTGAKIKVSHFKIRGSNNWHLYPVALDMFRQAGERGLEVYFDVYPYTSVWQPLHSYLPSWSMVGGRSVLLSYLANPVQRKKIISALSEQRNKFANMIVAGTGESLYASGKTFAHLAKNFSGSVEEAVLSVVELGGPATMVFEECLDESHVFELLKHKNALVGSDGAGFPVTLTGKESSLVHPRCFGAFPKYIIQARKSKNQISWSDISRKTSGIAADIFGLSNRGRLREGSMADIVLLDPHKLSSLATLSNPFRQSKGFFMVLTAGHLTVKEDVVTGEVGGRALA